MHPPSSARGRLTALLTTMSPVCFTLQARPDRRDEVSHLTEAAAYAAVDLGAESGRVVLGRFDGERVGLEVVHRFANRPVHLPDGLRWNLLALFAESLRGVALAAERSDLEGLGIDAWGVDYALLDERDRVLGLPFHYRDSRTEGMVARAHARVSRDELYAVAGIQTMPINTLFQLMADEGSAALTAGHNLAMLELRHHCYEAEAVCVYLRLRIFSERYNAQALPSRARNRV